MRYSLEPKYRKYVQGSGFWSLARKFGDKYGKKLMDTETKNRNRCCKNCFHKISLKNCRRYWRFDWKYNS